jgi:hypothetical protein
MAPHAGLRSLPPRSQTANQARKPQDWAISAHCIVELLRNCDPSLMVMETYLSNRMPHYLVFHPPDYHRTGSWDPYSGASVFSNNMAPLMSWMRTMSLPSTVTSAVPKEWRLGGGRSSIVKPSVLGALK